MPEFKQVLSGRSLAFAFALGGLMLLVILLPVAAQSPQHEQTALAPAQYQLLVNPGMEWYDPGYSQFHGIDCQVASGWQRFWYDGPEPCWMDTRVFADSHLGGGWVERIEGETSQLLVGTEPYTAGLQQRVGGLIPGVGYGFHAAMLTIFQTSAPPAADGTMIKQVGVDPTGGTDPRAAAVVWSPPDDHDEGPWDIDQRVAVFAQASEMTVFVRVISPYESGGLPYVNLGFLDSAILAQTPVVSASSPPVSQDPTFLVRWDNAVPAPGGTKLKWNDVQWMDEAEGIWHDWYTRTWEVESTFTGQPGHTYRFRARAWQRYPNGAHLHGPYRLEGDTSTTVAGPKLVGHVLTPGGRPVAGATVSVSGTSQAAQSDWQGRYLLRVQPGAEPQVATVNHSWWESPAPVHGLTFGLTETKALTWTLRSPDDAIINGEFEAGLAGWTPVTDQVGSASAVTEPVHTGHYALALEGADPGSRRAAPTRDSIVSLAQTVSLARAWQPVLSFWYRPAMASVDQAFTVSLEVVTHSVTSTLPVTTTYLFTPSLESEAWQHVGYDAFATGATLTGTVTIRFSLGGEDEAPVPTVYVDEVGLGPSPGGPVRVYLPLLYRRH